MTLEEIKAECDRAEQDGGINFDELPFYALSEWVNLKPKINDISTDCFDIISVLNMLEEWWKEQNRL